MSKLKTVWDAVNELRGDLNNTYMFNTGTDTHLLYCASQGIYTCVGRYIAFDEIVSLVSTVAEFNELVKEMTLGLDVNPVNHGHYLNYVYADKILLEKETKPDYTSLEFWKDAPEGAQYYKADCEKFFASWYKDITDHSYKTWVVGKSHSWTHCHFKSPCLIENMVKRPQSTPTETPEEKEALDSIVNKPLVYTQEMADNGELPSVGMKVMLEEDTDFFSCASGEIKTLKANDIVYVVAIGNRSDNNAPVITLMKQGAGFCTINPDYIKPIDQRTKKEKAIDEYIQSQHHGLESLSQSIKTIMKNAFEAGTEWVGE